MAKLSSSPILERSDPYRKTAAVCYLGNFVQAIVINLTPILFIPLRELYSLTYTQLGFLILANFVTQVIVDVVFSGLPDKHGYRPLALLGQAFAIIGLGLFALVPVLFGNIYLGLVITTIIFSAGGGLMEMLLSPMINAIPTEIKGKIMSVLHSFYAWGQLAVILITTALVAWWGRDAWQIIVVLWILVPIINFLLFLKVPIPSTIPDHERTRMKQYTKSSFFVVAIFTIMLGAATELSMAQWSSAYMEIGMGLPKLSGDLLGVAFFAFMLGTGRALFGKYGEKVNLNIIMIVGSIIAAICYLLVGLTRSPAISLFACGISGIVVSLLWPGTLVVTAEKFPLAGTSLFALLAAGGDIGASGGPWIISLVTDAISLNPEFSSFATTHNLTLEQLGLRAGILVGAIFPLLCALCHIWLYKNRDMGQIETEKKDIII